MSLPHDAALQALADKKIPLAEAAGHDPIDPVGSGLLDVEALLLVLEESHRGTGVDPEYAIRFIQAVWRQLDRIRSVHTIMEIGYKARVADLEGQVASLKERAEGLDVITHRLARGRKKQRARARRRVS